MAVAASNTVAKKESNDVPAHVLAAFDDFDSDITLTSSDYRIPRLQVISSTSKQAVEGDAKIGEYRKSNGQLIADKNTNVDIIVIKLDKYWRINETQPDGKYKPGGTTRREEWTRANDKRPWNFVEEGVHYKALLTIDVYLLLANEDGEEVFKQIPMIISLQSTGYRAAQDLNLEIQELKIRGFKVHQFVFTLGRDIDGAFASPTIKRGRQTTKQEMEAAAFFRSELQGNKVTTDEEAGN
jgi:hypothetical protein